MLAAALLAFVTGSEDLVARPWWAPIEPLLDGITLVLLLVAGTPWPTDTDGAMESASSDQ
jgi:hypothetical protein